MTINYTITAHPTVYNGRQYRSRLEAKWGVFFEMCGWRAEYEPYDMGLWSPDFLIQTHGADILVEVKPITMIDVPTIYKMHTAAEQTGFKGDLLLVGISIFSARTMGWLCTSDKPKRPEMGKERAGLSEEMQMIPWFSKVEGFGNREGPIDIVAPLWAKRSRSGITNETGLVFGTRISLFDQVCLGRSSNEIDLTKLWNQASNTVQWKPRR